MSQYYIFTRPTYELRGTMPSENSALAVAWNLANRERVGVDIMDDTGTVIEELEPACSE